MADYPSSIKTFTNPSASSTQDTAGVYHDVQHADANNEINAIETKLGIDNSADSTSIDYKLKNASSSNPGHKHTLAQGATDVTASAAELNTLDGITASTAELNYTDGVTSAIQTQLDSKQATMTKATGTDVDTGTDDAKYVTSKAIEDSAYAKTSAIPVKATGAEVTTGTDDAKFATAKAIADAGVNTRLKTKTLIISRVGNAENGDVAYTGVGFQPTALIAVWAIDAATSWGIGVADSDRLDGGIYDDSGDSKIYDHNVLIQATPGGGYMYASVKSFDSDGFTLTWTKALSPSSTTISITILCFR